MMMKPKGINIFQFDIMKSDNDSIVFKDGNKDDKERFGLKSKDIINIDL